MSAGLRELLRAHDITPEDVLDQQIGVPLGMKNKAAISGHIHDWNLEITIIAHAKTT